MVFNLKGVVRLRLLPCGDLLSSTHTHAHTARNLLRRGAVLETNLDSASITG